MVKGGAKRTVLIHCLVWVCFISYEVMVARSFGTDAGITEFAVFYFFDILLFYINSEIVFRLATSAKKVTLILIPLILVELTVFSIISLYLGLYVFKHPTDWSRERVIKDDLVRGLWRGIYILGLSIGYWFFKRTIKITKQKNQLNILQLETERSRVEIERNLAITQMAYLQSQINPHFLFNTLNYIYNSVVRVSEETSESILLLSEIMRYALTDTEHDNKVFLKEETDQIERYIRLTQMRFSNELFLVFFLDLDEGCYNCRIPPFILITFIENVFKHGDLTNSNEPANIYVQCKNDVVFLSTKNLKRTSRIPSNSNIGIKNAEKRLLLYYPKEDFELLMPETLTHFVVDLRIKL